MAAKVATQAQIKSTRSTTKISQILEPILAGCEGAGSGATGC
jgi:hypothetical protein